MDNKINNNSKKTGNRYSIEFKENAVKRKIEKGISAAQCARELGIKIICDSLIKTKHIAYYPVSEETYQKGEF